MPQTIPESLKTVIEILQDKKAENLSILDVRGLLPYTDYFVIATGNNAPHARTLGDSIAQLLKVPNVGGVRMESDQASSWILIDGGDFVLHIFQPKARSFYALEDLWEDAIRIEV